MVIISNFIKIMNRFLYFCGCHMNLDESIVLEQPEMKPTLTRKAILWGRDDLLTQAVHLFLESGTTWKVVRVSSEDDVQKLFQMITGIGPDVVVLCQDKVFEDSILPLRLINEQLCRKVVTLNLENNQMQVYSKHDVVIQGVPDLLCVIEAGLFSNCTTEKEVIKREP